jgi:hypothetical protein
MQREASAKMDRVYAEAKGSNKRVNDRTYVQNANDA